MKNFFLLFLALSLLPVGAAKSGAAPTAAISQSERIDQLIGKQLREQGLEPNPLASDEVYVRRAYLDLIGRTPTLAEVMEFLALEEKSKREDLIASLIGTDGYVSHQYNYWADLLRARTTIAGNNQSLPAGMAYERWIKDAIRENKPYNEMVYELVTASGSSWENPAIGYYLRDYGMPLDNLAITTQVFLGTQIVCAQCHDHPFDEWTQMDYYHLSAFTYPQVTTNNHPNQKKAMELLAKKKGKVSDSRRQDLRKAFSEILFPVRFNNVVQTNRSLRLPHDYQYDDAKPKAIVKPTTLMGNEAVISPSRSTVEAFGEWLTSSENPRFTTVIANRLWKRAMGVGLIEPVDDFKSHTAASNPELMTYLEKLLVEMNYDLQGFQKVLYQTKAYQREAALEEPVPGAPYHFAGPILRRMSAEQIWDSLVALTVENPDRPSAGRALLADQKLAAVRLVAEAVYDQRPAEFLRNANEVAAVQKDLAVEIASAQQKITKAREDGDPELIKEASKQVREIRKRLGLMVEEKVYKEGLTDKLGLFETASLKEGVEDPGGEAANEFLNSLSAAMQGGGAEEGSMMNSMASAGKTGVIDQLVEALFAEKKQALIAEKKAEEAREIEEWRVKKREDLKAYKGFGTVKRRMVRASELNSPSPPGHFLREFGQSDRELVENASDEASITQALAMLNGPVLHAVANRYSVLSRDMKGESFSDRLDVIYLSMLSRKPTPQERKIFQEAWKSDPGTGSVTGIVWTVLNTRQFLFIQ